MNPRNRIPDEISESFSVLGEPLSAATYALRDAGVLRDQTNVIVTLDQFEVLVRTSPYLNDSDRTQEFVRVVDELIASREQSVSYRIGTRPNTQLRLSDASRDYVLVDMDRVFRRTESGRRGKNGLFYQLAEDALRRRMRTSRMPVSRKVAESLTPIQELFGSSPKNSERANKAAPSNPQRAIKLDDKWPDDVKSYLSELTTRNVLSARLGEAWVRQAFGSKGAGKIVAPDEWRVSGVPAWEADDKDWWRKERLPLATIQIAASNAQQLQYSGHRDIVQLSGLNILVFISICREIWECNTRYITLGRQSQQQEFALPIASNRQAEGIRDASKQWQQKISASPDGDTLQSLIDILGQKLHSQLISDRQMSYPGANGFSLAKSDLENYPKLKLLLDAGTAECYLVERDHTPKNIARGKSLKWYLHPILSPYYGLTVPHTKEPLYLSAKKLVSWLSSRFASQLFVADRVSESRSMDTKLSDVDVDSDSPADSSSSSGENVWKQQSLWPEADE